MTIRVLFKFIRLQPNVLKDESLRFLNLNFIYWFKNYYTLCIIPLKVICFKNCIIWLD